MGWAEHQDHLGIQDPWEILAAMVPPVKMEVQVQLGRMDSQVKRVRQEPQASEDPPEREVDRDPLEVGVTTPRMPSP